MAVVDQPAASVELPVENALTASGLTGETLTLRVFKGVPGGEQAEVAYEVPVVAGMVILDAVHYVQHNLDTDLACRWNCKAAKCGSCCAEINGTPADVHDPSGRPPRRAGHGRADEVIPADQGPGHRRLVELRGQEKIKPFTPRTPDAPMADLAHAQADMDRVQEFRKCIECFLCQDVCHVLRDHHKHDRVHRPAILRPHGRAGDASARHRRPPSSRSDEKHGIGYCNITKCCTEVCPEHITITDNAIIPLKERVADVHWDPVRFVGRKLFGRSGD